MARSSDSPRGNLLSLLRCSAILTGLVYATAAANLVYGEARFGFPLLQRGKCRAVIAAMLGMFAEYWGEMPRHRKVACLETLASACVSDEGTRAGDGNLAAHRTIAVLAD